MKDFDKGYYAGFAVATALVAQFGLQADQLMKETGVTFQDLNRAGVDRHDIDIIAKAVNVTHSVPFTFAHYDSPIPEFPKEGIPVVLPEDQ